MLAPDIAAAACYGIDAQLLTEACNLDRANLDQWLDAAPAEQYCAALRVHAHVLNSRNAIREPSAR